jgi:site-specific DNA-methyltransferase (adenine-specific)
MPEKVVIGSAELWHGDCMEVLPLLPRADAVITDPPYSSGGMVRGDRMQATNQKYSGWGGGAGTEASEHTFTGDTRDQRAFLTWCTLWLGQLQRLANTGAHLLAFTDWRQLPTMTDAVQCGGWVWRGLLVWDKGIARPMKGRFRNHVEYMVWASNGPIDGDANPVYLDCVFNRPPPPSAGRNHLTEKPEELMADVLQVVRPGGLVVDPFMGSGTTGVAAVKYGRKFVGCEIDRRYFDTACRRIEAAQAQGSLLDDAGAPEQVGLALEP